MGKIIFITMLWLTCQSGIAAEYYSSQQAQSFANTLSVINNHSPLEDAGSHGLNGLTLGAGALVNNQMHDEPLFKRNTYEDQAPSTTLIPKIFITKGFGIPLDLGIGFGFAEENRVHQWAGYAQYTLFEAMAWPSVALRSSYSKLSGWKFASSTTWANSIAISYSFLNYVTVVGTVGQLTTRALLNSSQQNEQFYFQLSDGPRLDYRSQWRENFSSIGVKLKVLPPFGYVMLETQRHERGGQNILLKLAVGP